MTFPPAHGPTGPGAPAGPDAPVGPVRLEGTETDLGVETPAATAAAGRHGGAVESGPGDDDGDFLEIEQFARLKRLARKPGPVLFAVLPLGMTQEDRERPTDGAQWGAPVNPNLKKKFITTTWVSAQPVFSKWWCSGAMRSRRRPSP